MSFAELGSGALTQKAQQVFLSAWGPDQQPPELHTARTAPTAPACLIPGPGTSIKAGGAFKELILLLPVTRPRFQTLKTLPNAVEALV